MPLAGIEEGLEDLKQGKLLIVVDDEKRENEGDLVMPAEMVTPEAVNFMVTHARGLLCTPVLGERLEELEMPLMVNGDNNSKHGTAFTVSVDYKVGTTTGISAQDRAATIKAMMDPEAKPEDFSRPGHTFPLRYEEGGVMTRPGHTEAVVDLARMAGMYPAGIVCEIMNEDGSMARMPELEEFSRRHDLKIITIAQIIAYRRRTENLIHLVAEAPPAHRPRRVQDQGLSAQDRAGRAPGHGRGPVGARRAGAGADPQRVPHRDVFGSLRCDCGEQIDKAMDIIGKEGRGVFLYMRQEGRGIGLHNKIKAYSLQDNGLDTIQANETLGFESDLRHYGIAAQILSELGIKKMRFMTNNPRKMVGLSGYDLEIVERVPLEIEVNEENRLYLRTKRGRMGHVIAHC